MHQTILIKEKDYICFLFDCGMSITPHCTEEEEKRKQEQNI
jgi:hypothetical protein